jgi:hypothetical protein
MSRSRLTRFAGRATDAIERATPIVLEIVKAVTLRTTVIDLSTCGILAILTSK